MEKVEKRNLVYWRHNWSHSALTYTHLVCCHGFIHLSTCVCCTKPVPKIKLITYAWEDVPIAAETYFRVRLEKNIHWFYRKYYFGLVVCDVTLFPVLSVFMLSCLIKHNSSIVPQSQASKLLCMIIKQHVIILGSKWKKTILMALIQWCDFMLWLGDLLASKC